MMPKEEDKTVLQAAILSDHHATDTEQTRFEGPSSHPVQTEIANNPDRGAITLTGHDFTEPLQVGLNVGDVLKSRFQIIECLGQGGMGMVFKAQDMRKVEAKSHNPYVAIKVLNPALAKNQLLVAGLQRECEKAQELSHPNIITVYDFDRDGDLVYMSMEYLVGQSLSQLIQESATAGGVRIQRAWPLILDMATALAYAHRKGIVHSDFKPANVFITQDHKVKVLDFGIAARTEKGNDNDATIFNARVEGGHTPTYASFEMMNGAKADPRDDIYAFGLVVYELLTGKHPYNRKSASEVFIEQQKTNKPATPAPVKGLSRRQWQALKSALEILQDKRPKNLETWLEQFDPKAGRWSPQLLGGAITAILLMASFGINYWLSGPGQPSIPAARPAASPGAGEQPLFKLPVAHAGSDQPGHPGQAVLLDGGASQSGDGEAIQYAWRLTRAPLGSSAILQNADAVNPQLIPDKVGEYVVELLVRDKHNVSIPTPVKITVTEPEPGKEAALHQFTSADGLLSLAAGKAQYRIGEQLKLNVRVLKSGYLRVVYIGAAGEVSELLPNQYQPSQVKADTEYVIPPKGKFKLQVTGPAGIDKIVAVLSDSPITNLEKMVDANGDIARQIIQNNITATIQYGVVK